MRLLIPLVCGLALAPAALASPCQVSGEAYVDRVTVRPVEAAPFDLRLAFAPATAALPTRAGQPMVLTMSGLAFQAEIARPALTVVREVASLDGMAMMRPGAQVVDARDVGGAVVATLVLDVADRRAGDDAPEVVLRELTLPCDALSLDERVRVVTAHAGRASGRVYPGYGHLAGDWMTRRARAIALRPRPHADAPAHWLIATRCADQRFALAGVWREGEWIQVVRGGEEALARGWIHRDELEGLSSGDAPADTTCEADDGGPRAAESGSASGDRGRAARLRVGARVYASAGLGEWARAERAVAVSFVPLPGSAWAELRWIERLDGAPAGTPLQHAYVARDQLIPASR